MCCQAGVDPWLQTLTTPLPQVSTPQATGLALGGFGRVLARSGALTAVRSRLATGMPRQEQTVRQQRRAWYDDAKRTSSAWRDTAGRWSPAVGERICAARCS